MQIQRRRVQTSNRCRVNIRLVRYTIMTDDGIYLPSVVGRIYEVIADSAAYSVLPPLNGQLMDSSWRENARASSIDLFSRGVRVLSMRDNGHNWRLVAPVE